MLQKFTGNLVNPWRRCVTLYVTVHDKKSLSETVWLTGGKSNCFPFPIWRARASNISLISVTMGNLLDQQLRLKEAIYTRSAKCPRQQLNYSFHPQSLATARDMHGLLGRKCMSETVGQFLKSWKSTKSRFCKKFASPPAHLPVHLKIATGARFKFRHCRWCVLSQK